MPSFNSISAEKLSRLVGLPSSPLVVDVRSDDDVARDPRLVPGAIRRASPHVSHWAAGLPDKAMVVACADGMATGEAVAAQLRHLGRNAEVLERGVAGWAGAGLPMVSQAKLPPRDADGRTTWVTRARPKVDRIACPWLIRRFVDPAAIFLFAGPAAVQPIAARLAAAPFDIEGDGVDWSHRGERCTFDVMVDELGLSGFPALGHLAVIVRGADTGRPDLAPECAGLLAASLGLSRMFTNDQEQLEAGMMLYDALYRWCRDATDEVHNWTSHRPPGSPTKSTEARTKETS